MMILLQAETHAQPEKNAQHVVVPQSTCETSDECVSRCAAYGNVCPCNARCAGRTAQNKISKIITNSELFKDGKPDFRTTKQSEIIMGNKLGEGGFCMVHACALKEAPLEERLAIKYLKRRIMVERKCFEHGASDLVTEAFFLAKLDHPNIIKLHSVTEGSVEKNVSAGEDGGYFIVVDRLVETLEKRIERWRKQAEEIPNSLFYRLSRDCRERQKKLLKERVEIAFEVAKVMEYLHSLNIAFRDLKPDNVGFNSTGKLKLFDFGLAKEEKLCDVVEDCAYKMTGHTGSRRYMAPEVATQKPYSKSVDVFSFGILLWEICSMEKPFSGYSSTKHMKEVVLGGERPKMDSSHIAHWPVDLQWLMKSSWSSDPEKRPSFSVVKETLQAILEEMETPTSERTRATSEGTHQQQQQHHQYGLSSSPKRKQHRQWKMSRITSRS